jgi:hypothetical protein
MADVQHPDPEVPVAAAEPAAEPAAEAPAAEAPAAEAPAANDQQPAQPQPAEQVAAPANQQEFEVIILLEYVGCQVTFEFLLISVEPYWTNDNIEKP